MNKQLAGGSPEMAKIGIPFVNATNETIPPYACMEIVGNPKNWEGKRATTEEDENAFKMGYHRYLGVGQYYELDRSSTIFCAKPSRWIDALQDPTRVAFNSASPVEPKGIGRCFSEPYPVRALVSQLHSARSMYYGAPALRIQANEWHLLATTDGDGAFRYKEFTSQYVSVRSGTGTSATVSWPVYQICPSYHYKPQVHEARGIWYFDGAKKTDMYLLPEWRGTNGGFLFDQDQSIVLRAPGYYQFIFAGVLKQKGASDRSTFIPYSIRLASTRTRDDDNWYTTDSELGGTDRRENKLWQYTEKWDVEKQEYGPFKRADGEIKSKDRLRWTVNDIYYFSQIYVDKPPVQISVAQELSPAIATHDMNSGLTIEKIPTSFTQPFGMVSIFYLLDQNYRSRPIDQFRNVQEKRFLDFGERAVFDADAAWWNFKTIERFDDAFPWREVP